MKAAPETEAARTDGWRRRVAIGGDQGTRDARVLEHLSWVTTLALSLKRTLPKWVDLDDLVGAGAFGLVSAVDQFDPGRGVSFRRFARARVIGSMLDEVRRLGWVPRSDSGIAKDRLPAPIRSLDALDPSDRGPAEPLDEAAADPVAYAAGRELMESVRRHTSAAEFEVLVRYYRGGQSMRRIGRSLHRSESRVRQLWQGAVARLRRRMDQEAR